MTYATLTSGVTMSTSCEKSLSSMDVSRLFMDQSLCRMCQTYRASSVCDNHISQITLLVYDLYFSWRLFVQNSSQQHTLLFGYDKIGSCNLGLYPADSRAHFNFLL